jgi:hypothetical protein
MRLATFGVIIATAIVSVSATLLLAAVPASQPDWEYHVSVEAPQQVTEINTLGSQGWELVSVVVGDQGNHYCYLKRPTLR